ncbi:MAG: hypothetical protein QOH33_2204, partial [Paraburkholderia sp.]|nr:hypothetical protein [Paraburkholderia sp.]
MPLFVSKRSSGWVAKIDMVRVQVSAFRVPALLASESVAAQHVVSP